MNDDYNSAIERLAASDDACWLDACMVGDKYNRQNRNVIADIRRAREALKLLEG